MGRKTKALENYDRFGCAQEHTDVLCATEREFCRNESCEMIAACMCLSLQFPIDYSEIKSTGTFWISGC